MRAKKRKEERSERETGQSDGGGGWLAGALLLYGYYTGGLKLSSKAAILRLASEI